MGVMRWKIVFFAFKILFKMLHLIMGAKNSIIRKQISPTQEENDKICALFIYLSEILWREIFLQFCTFVPDEFNFSFQSNHKILVATSTLSPFSNHFLLFSFYFHHFSLARSLDTLVTYHQGQGVFEIYKHIFQIYCQSLPRLI